MHRKNQGNHSYGKYIWTSKDASGKEEISKGIFHTVWKKQKDGSWKNAIDIMSPDSLK